MNTLPQKLFKWSADLNIYNTLSLWLWGADYTPDDPSSTLPDLNDRIRFADNDLLRDSGQSSIRIDANDYLTNGPGSFVNLSHSLHVQ
jgi:hypothetical protein